MSANNEQPVNAQAMLVAQNHQLQLQLQQVQNQLHQAQQQVAAAGQQQPAGVPLLHAKHLAAPPRYTGNGNDLGETPLRNFLFKVERFCELTGVASAHWVAGGLL